MAPLVYAAHDQNFIREDRVWHPFPLWVFTLKKLRLAKETPVTSSILEDFNSCDIMQGQYHLKYAAP